MEIVETPICTDEITKLLSDDEYKELQNYLAEHPTSGDIIKGSKVFENCAGNSKAKVKAEGFGISTITTKSNRRYI